MKVEDNSNILVYYGLLLQERLNATEMPKKKKKRYVVYGECGVTNRMCQKVVCKVLCWRFLAGCCYNVWVDQLKLIVIKLRH